VEENGGEEMDKREWRRARSGTLRERLLAYRHAAQRGRRTLEIVLKQRGGKCSACALKVAARKSVCM